MTSRAISFCGGGERVSSLSEDLHQILCRITASQTRDGVRQSVRFVDGHCVRHTDTRDRHSAGRVSRSAQRRSSLGRHVRGGHVERLKSGLRHALSVSLGVQKSFRGPNGMPFRRNPELLNEWCWISFMSFQFVTIKCTTIVPSICIPPWAGGSAAIVVGACDPGGHPPGFAPRSPRHAGSNAHLSKKHLSQEDVPEGPL